MASTAIELKKIVVQLSWAEAPVANDMATVQVPPTTNQLEDFQASCLASTEEEVTEVEEIIENFEVESGNR